MQFTKVYYLGTCDTCKRIFRELNLDKSSGNIIDLKKQMPDNDEISNWFDKSESDPIDFINKRSRQLKRKDLDYSNMEKSEIVDLLLSHYSIIARPVFVFEDDVIPGNSKKSVEKVRKKLTS
ncbi:arsenate reductase family protein [Mangrovivirga cuniculi]|uniref:Arsenate reductase n=1 Tax=Mangrovivirga cuniculi TaxID=2715131 RepID=A0A4D7JWS6_9BACT|nr:ArsC/Spx/MgsR family protein [Mangrovivirga cuniculi]QCK15255.1 hypothetical protein DCC35_11105 [Mangrovivirga cuniculi]